MFVTNEIDSIKGNNKLIKKSIKPKIRKLSKSQKSAKLGKKLLKNRSLPNFKIKENRSSFLTFKTRLAFNYLWLAIIKALIL